MIKEVKKLAKEYGYIIYDEPYKLNIWGFRSKNNVPNSFDDEIHCFMNVRTKEKPQWLYMVFKATTDPGTFWLNNPMKPQGTAILNPGQYVDVYKIDLHRGQYKALCQRNGYVSVTRDYNRDSVLDFNNGKVERGTGINIHRSSQVGKSTTVDKYSAGCQVFQHAFEFEFFMRLCELHRQQHGNKFTYTLVDKRMEFRRNIKLLGAAALALSMVLGFSFFSLSDTE